MVEIVRLLRPLLYRVVLPDGAVVRRTVELASGHVRTVASGEVVEVRDGGDGGVLTLTSTHSLTLGDGVAK